MKYLSQQVQASTSITPSFNGVAIDASQLLQASFQVVTTGSSPTGTVKIQVSNDVCTTGNMPQTFTPHNWTDLSGATISYSSDTTYLIPKTDLCYRWVRVVNTFASGTGTVVVNMFAVSV